MRLPSAEEICEGKEILLHDIEKKLRFKDDTPHFAHQQVLGRLWLSSSNWFLLFLLPKLQWFSGE